MLTLEAPDPPALKTLMNRSATGENKTIWRTELNATKTAQSADRARASVHRCKGLRVSALCAPR